MRISGGRARGITLSVPRGDKVRPATDGLRQAVFSSLAPRIPDARFLDLFAGSGAYGLEALSRGAASGQFVEKSARAADCLQTNLEAVAKSLGRNAREMARISRADVLDWSPPASDGESATLDLVFIDPPYEIIPEISPTLFARLRTWLAGSAKSDPIVVFETPGELALTPAGWEIIKRIGGTAPRQPGVTLFRPDPSK